MSKDRKSASAKTQQHIEETAYINSVLSPSANSEVTVSKSTIELVKNVTKWPEEDILRVLKDSGNDPQLAINKILDGSAGKPTQWTEVQGKRLPKAETKPNKPNKPANGVQSRDGGGKTYKTDEKRDDRSKDKKREAQKRPPKNAPVNQEQNQQTAQPQVQQQVQPQTEANQKKEPEVQTNQGSSQNTTTSAPSQPKPTRSSKENGTTTKQSVGGWGKPPASIYTDSNHQSPPVMSQPPSQTQPVVVESTPVANPPANDKPKQDNLPRWGPQSKSLQTQAAPSTTHAPSSTTSQNANASPASSSSQVQSSESQLEEVQPVQSTQTSQPNQSKSSPSTAPRQGYNPPSMKAWKPKDAKSPNDQPQNVQQVPAQSTQPVPTPQVSSVSQPQPQQQASSQSQPPKTTPTTTPTNKPTPAPYAPVVPERSAVILPPSSVALISGNTQDVHFGVFGSTFTETSTQTRTEASRAPNTQYQASHATEVSHAHAHPHTDRLGVEHLHIAEAYSPDHQAPQMEDPHANQIPPYFLPPSYIPTFAPQFTYETDPSLRAMHVYDPNQVQGYQPHNLGYQQGIPDSKYGENNYAENKYGAPDSSNTAQNPQGTQSQGPQTQPQHPAYYSSPIYPYPYPPNQYSFQNPSVTPSQYLPPRFYQRPFPANYPGNSTYMQPGAPTGVQPVGATHAYPGAEEQDVYKPPVQFSVPMSSYFLPPEANPSMLGKPSQSAAPKGQSQVNYSQGNPTPQNTTEQNQAFKTNQTAYQPGNNPRESYYNMQQPQYGQVQGQSNYPFVPQTQPQVQSSQPFPRGQYQ